MALTRNPANVVSLVDGQIMISLEDDPKIGKLGKFGPEWHTAGILADGGAVSVTRSIDENTVSGFGYGVVSRTTKAGDCTGTFEVLEDNKITRMIAWPDTIEKDGVEIKRHSNKVLRAHVAIVRVREDDVVQIDVTRHKAQLRMEDVGRGEEVEGRTVNVSYIPGPDKDVFETRYFGIEGDSLVELDPIRFVEDGTIKGDVKAGTAYQAGEAAGKELDHKPGDDPAPKAEEEEDEGEH